MRSNNGRTGIRRFLITGCCSVLLHGIIAAVILPGIGSKKNDSERTMKVYSVEVRRLQPKMEQTGEVEPLAPKPPELNETPGAPEIPEAIDLTEIAVPISTEAEELPEEAFENAAVVETIEMIETIETPIPPVEKAFIAPGVGLDFGEDAEDGGGNSLLASGAERGWGGASYGDGWGGGSGAPGSGVGYGSGAGNSRGGAGGEKTAGGETGVYSAGMFGIIPPVYQRTPQPAYPAAARRRGEEGDVLLKVEVLADGRVGRAEVEGSSGFALLDEAALRTVRNWRFRPALKGRDVVACWVNIPVRFRLD